MRGKTWQAIDDKTPKDRPILAMTCHMADWHREKVQDGDLYYYKMSPYLFNAEANGHVEDGIHVLVYGGGYTDGIEDGGGSAPDGWFLAGSGFEIAANPILWIEIDERSANLLAVHLFRNEGLKAIPEKLKALAA